MDFVLHPKNLGKQKVSICKTIYANELQKIMFKLIFGISEL